MPKRPLAVRLGWTLRDYAKRVWDNSGEDNVFFLAGGIAFNILLAAVPFCLLLVSGLATLLNHSLNASLDEVLALVDRLLPPHAETQDNPFHRLVSDAMQAPAAVSIWSAIGFVWFSTRLFGSLRSVLAEVFDIENERGIIAGKIFDIQITVISTVLVAVYTVLSAYLAFATTRGIQVLAGVGLRRDLMGSVEYTLGRLLAFAFMVLMFFSLYRFLPVRRIRSKTALVAALFTAGMFELARNVFTAYITHFDPGSFYRGTLYAVVIVVFWVYYAALIFILGGEVGQVYDLRRVRRLQRETFED